MICFKVTFEKPFSIVKSGKLNVRGFVENMSPEYATRTLMVTASPMTGVSILPEPNSWNIVGGKGELMTTSTARGRMLTRRGMMTDSKTEEFNHTDGPEKFFPNE